MIFFSLNAAVSRIDVAGWRLDVSHQQVEGQLGIDRPVDLLHSVLARACAVLVLDRVVRREPSDPDLVPVFSFFDRLAAQLTDAVVRIAPRKERRNPFEPGQSLLFHAAPYFAAGRGGRAAFGASGSTAKFDPLRW